MSIRTRIVQVLAVVGAASIIALLAGGLYLGVVASRGITARDKPSAVETRLARTARRLTTPPRAKALENPLEPAEAVIAEARAHFADHCALCHANDGSGVTPIGQNLYPRAPDLRARSTQKLSDGELYFIIQNGIRFTGMPAWGKAGEDSTHSWALVRFLRHLPNLTPEELEEMKSLNPKSPQESGEPEEHHHH